MTHSQPGQHSHGSPMARTRDGHCDPTAAPGRASLGLHSLLRPVLLLPCPALSSLVQPCPALSSLVQPCLAVSGPVGPCPALSCCKPCPLAGIAMGNAT